MEMIIRTYMVTMISIIGMKATIAPVVFRNIKAMPFRPPTALALAITLVITEVYRRIETGTPQGPKIF